MCFIYRFNNKNLRCQIISQKLWLPLGEWEGLWGWWQKLQKRMSCCETVSIIKNSQKNLKTEARQTKFKKCCKMVPKIEILILRNEFIIFFLLFGSGVNIQYRGKCSSKWMLDERVPLCYDLPCLCKFTREPDACCFKHVRRKECEEVLS